MVLLDVAGIVHPDLGTVEALARIQLAARRSGNEVRLRGAGEELRALLSLAGLLDVLPPCPELVEPGGQTEHGEHPLGVEEERDPGDGAA